MKDDVERFKSSLDSQKKYNAAKKKEWDGIPNLLADIKAVEDWLPKVQAHVAQVSSALERCENATSVWNALYLQNMVAGANALSKKALHMIRERGMVDTTLKKRRRADDDEDDESNKKIHVDVGFGRFTIDDPATNQLLCTPSVWVAGGGAGGGIMGVGTAGATWLAGCSGVAIAGAAAAPVVAGIGAGYAGYRYFVPRYSSAEAKVEVNAVAAAAAAAEAEANAAAAAEAEANAAAGRTF